MTKRPGVAGVIARRDDALDWLLVREMVTGSSSWAVSSCVAEPIRERHGFAAGRQEVQNEPSGRGLPVNDPEAQRDEGSHCQAGET